MPQIIAPTLRTLLTAFSAALLSLLVLALPFNADAQRRDYMTEEEIELVRDAQDIDLRMTVLTQMIDRRFTALGIEIGGWKQREKDLEKWGEAPAGSRTELFSDIRKLLEKAIDDLDVIAERNDDALKQNKTDGELFPVAVGILETAAKRYQPVLDAESEKAPDERQRGLILTSAEHCANIIEAAARIPAEQKVRKKKGSKSKADAAKPN